MKRLIERYTAYTRKRRARVTPCRHDWSQTTGVKTCQTCHVKRYEVSA